MGHPHLQSLQQISTNFRSTSTLQHRMKSWFQQLDGTSTFFLKQQLYNLQLWKMSVSFLYPAALCEVAFWQTHDGYKNQSLAVVVSYPLYDGCAAVIRSSNIFCSDVQLPWKPLSNSKAPNKRKSNQAPLWQKLPLQISTCLSILNGDNI